MAQVTVLDAGRMLAIEAASIVSGSVDASGQVTFTTHDGTEVDGGNIMPTVPDATESTKGVVTLASVSEATTGTDTIKAVTSAGVEANVTAAVNALTKSDVGLSNVDNTADIAKPVSTPQQTALNTKANSYNYSGSTYAAANAGIYVGPVDPGSVLDGSIWYQTAS